MDTLTLRSGIDSYTNAKHSSYLQRNESICSDPSMSENSLRIQIQVALNNMFQCGTFIVIEQKKAINQSIYQPH